MRREAEVRLMCPGGRSETAEVWVTEAAPWALEVRVPSIGTVSASGDDLFDCLCEVRSELNARDYWLCCNGARRDVYVSPMSSAAGGRMALAFRMGEQARRRDLLDIFGEARVEMLASVEDQRRNFEEWLKSLAPR